MKKQLLTAVLLFAILAGLAGTAQALTSPTLTVGVNGLKVDISWTSTDNPDGYVLFYAPYPGADPVYQLDLGPQTGISVDLWDGAALYVAVQAYTNSGDTAFSNVESFVLGSQGGSSGGASGTGTYYVSTTGDDANDGSQSTPWATLQQAADSVTAGDTVIVSAGTYSGFRSTTTGTASAPITFQADTGAFVMINEAGANNDFDHIELEGVSHWTLDGFHILASGRYGLRVQGTATDKADTITVQNNTILNSNKSGMYLEFADNALVQNNVLGHNGYIGIHFKADGDYPVIRNNVVYSSEGGGIQVNGAEDFGGDGLMSFATITENRVFENGIGGSGGAIGMDGVTDSTITYNDLYNNGSMGIDIFMMDGASANVDNTFTNNVISQSAGDDWGIRIACLTCTDNTFTANKIYHADTGYGAIKIPKSKLSITSDTNELVDRLSVDGGTTLISLADWQSYGFDTNSDTLGSEPAANNSATALDGTYTYFLYDTDGVYSGEGTVTFSNGEMIERNHSSGCGELTLSTSATTLNTNTGQHDITHEAGCKNATTTTYTWNIVSTDSGSEFSGYGSAGKIDWYIFGMK